MLYDHEQIDAMLMRKLVAIRQGLRDKSLNPQWVNQRLQDIADKNHAGDKALRPIYCTLTRPTRAEVKQWLDRSPRGAGNQLGQVGFARDLGPRLEHIDWLSDARDKVDLIIGTMDNLFAESTDTQETEGLARALAVKAGLHLCPDWVVPALCVWAEKNDKLPPQNAPSPNLCLAGDKRRGYGFCIQLRRKWHLYARSVDDSPWSSTGGWMFVKHPK